MVDVTSPRFMSRISSATNYLSHGSFSPVPTKILKIPFIVHCEDNMFGAPRTCLGRHLQLRGQKRIISRAFSKEVSEDRLKISKSPDNPFPDGMIHRTAEMAHGSRQYFLLHPSLTLLEALKNPELAYGSIYVRRNIIFGARLHVAASTEDPSSTVANVCPPLLEAIFRDAPKEQGEQPRALSTLYGLCDWVRQGLEKHHQSDVLDKLWQGEAIPKLDTLSPNRKSPGNDPGQDNSLNSTIQLDAVQAIATGIPRPGESRIGPSVMQDAVFAWQALAREFIQKQPSDECQLYLTADGELVEIEHDAEKNPNYVASTGGAMAHFFFV